MILDLTQCTGIENLDFKLIYANNNLSAAITKEGELYIWGEIAIGGEYFSISKIALVKVNDSKSSVIVDNIAVNDGIFLAIGKVLDNENYVKKLFSLDFKLSYDYYQTTNFSFNEIKLTNEKNKNSRISPLKICIGDNTIFVLCIENEYLIKEIKENNIKEQNKTECEIEIINNYIEDNDTEKISKFYNSDNLNKFIHLFLSFSENNISKIIEAFDKIKEIKDENNNNSGKNINYTQLIEYLKGIDDDLLLFFTKNESNESKSIFNYLKYRIDLIEKNLIKYVKANIKSKTQEFLQKIITNNIIYLSDNLRLEYFNTLLTNTDARYENNLYGIEYDDNMGANPRNLKINRFKSKAFYDKFNENSEKIPDLELNETIFGQVFHYYENVNGKNFLLRKGEKLFKVDLQDEQAIDMGGPYHEVISCMCDELQSDYLDLFIKTPNNKNNLGKLRDKYMINPNSNENIHQKAYEFIGKLMAMAISSGEALNLNLHPIIWKKIIEEKINNDEYESIDHIFFNNVIKPLEEIFKTKNEDLLNDFDLNFVIKNSNETDIELINNAKKVKVNLDNLEEYIKLAKEKRFNEINNQIDYIKKGIYSAIDKNLLQILNWKQLEEMVCGKKIRY